MSNIEELKKKVDEIIGSGLEAKEDLPDEIGKEDFFYDLFLGGYIKPSDILANPEQVELVTLAEKIISEFKDLFDELYPEM